MVPLALALINLSPIEKLMLEPRLNDIQSSIRQKYQPIISASAVTIDTFIFPGAGGVDVLIEALQETMGESSMIVDWQDQRGSILTAAYDGEAVGKAISDAVFAGDTVRNTKQVHLIGVSVGGFAANAAATLLYQQKPEQQQNDTDSCEIRLTLLDPFCGRGVFQPSYGKNHFGKYADTAIHILNTDDPVPTTNDPLPYCYCLDVTKAPEREEFVPLPGDSMHSWPLAYFAWKDGKVGGGTDTYPRGVVVKVEVWSTESMPPLPW